MIDYYIVVDSINESGLITFRVYKFNPEISLKPIRIIIEHYETINMTIDMIINIIEDLIHTQDDRKIYILSEDMFLRDLFDNDINKFNHLRINYNRTRGYRAFYTMYNNNNESSVIELLDVSASGIMKYLRKIKADS